MFKVVAYVFFAESYEVCEFDVEQDALDCAGALNGTGDMYTSFCVEEVLERIT